MLSSLPYMLAFLMIPAMTCSSLPCIYSSHMTLVSLFNRLIEPSNPTGYGAGLDG